jgi:hypothetical protein
MPCRVISVATVPVSKATKPMKTITCKGSIPSGLLSRVVFTARLVLHWRRSARFSMSPDKPFTDLLVQFYGFYGYSVSMVGILVGAFWGLIEGFVHFGIFAWLYNMLLAKT